MHINLSLTNFLLFKDVFSGNHHQRTRAESDKVSKSINKQWYLIPNLISSFKPSIIPEHWIQHDILQARVALLHWKCDFDSNITLNWVELNINRVELFIYRMVRNKPVEITKSLMWKMLRTIFNSISMCLSWCSCSSVIRFALYDQNRMHTFIHSLFFVCFWMIKQNELNLGHTERRKVCLITGSYSFEPIYTPNSTKSNTLFMRIES